MKATSGHFVLKKNVKYRDLAKVLFQKGDLEGAIEECKKVI